MTSVLVGFLRSNTTQFQSSDTVQMRDSHGKHRPRLEPIEEVMTEDEEAESK